MIQFYINGEKQDVQLEGEETIGEVLKAFEQTCEANDAAVIGININDIQITAETFDEASKKKLEDNTKFEFSVVTKQEIHDSFAQLAELFNSLSIKMEAVPLDLQNGKTEEVSKSITSLADNINSFSHVATLAYLFPESFKEIKINGLSFKDFFIDFSPVLKDFEQALETKDSVMIGDLAEYEICPRLHSISEALKAL